jgi:aspartate carbamoyltransferase catalytic subunit
LVALVGDLKHTRSTNSLTLGLSNFDVEMIFVSPPGFGPSPWILDRVKTRGIRHRLTQDLKEAVGEADVVYVSRIQKERLADPSDYDRIKGSYVLNRSILAAAPKVVTVMHHLPRVGELAEDVDDYPGAAYFRQPLNGVLVRAAALTIVFDRIPLQ